MNPTESTRQGYNQSPPEIQRYLQLTPFWQNLARLKYNSEAMLNVLHELYVKRHMPANEFPFIKKSYSRTTLFKEKSGFEIIAIRWDIGAVTSVHGHPGFSLFYLIEGELLETTYTCMHKNLLEISSGRYGPGDFSCHVGDFRRFDNAIHKISAAANSLSLHLYSDDAIKGERYSIS